MKLSLRWKMLLVVFGLIIAPVLILGVDHYWTTRNLIADMMRTTTYEALQGGLEAADSFLRSAEEAVVMLNKMVLGDAGKAWRRYSRHTGALTGISKTCIMALREFYVDPSRLAGCPQALTPQPGHGTPKRCRREIIWTDPYVDTGSGELVVTAAMPVYQGSKGALGVVGIDVTLSDSLT